ncbi:MAG: hypothetical protein ACREQX_16525 [Candidatus Binataceae bacterium]
MPFAESSIRLILLGVIVVLIGEQTASAQTRPPSNGFVDTQSIDTIADTPGATLLLPYFEVDLKSRNGMTTRFTINNNDAAAALAHVTIWSDLAVPVFDFNVYLTGYDVVTIDLRDVLNGILPQTASAGQDPNNTISPKGSLSQDINFASCSANSTTNPFPNALSIPSLPPFPLSQAQIAHLQNALTGRPPQLLNGMCAGFAHGDHIARGYITVDAIDACVALFPSDAGYFVQEGAGLATLQNYLTGEVFYVNQKQKTAWGGDLARFMACSTTQEPIRPEI